eukprot:CAMPEP_0194582646 /NCGR_PEP_ID=MMETSP0292-20121207/15755_1 /TAXON_ID=39354 /ORGANISM="Heterosigma akashiwo, Strain CCMP2393" /LENGTH=79 /DNA_ID=CAMNT_0039436891 /DNA_START=44 /DNA_END=280 /DNA_ORIENTATION=+
MRRVLMEQRGPRGRYPEDGRMGPDIGMKRRMDGGMGPPGGFGGPEDDGLGPSPGKLRRMAEIQAELSQLQRGGRGGGFG